MFNNKTTTNSKLTYSDSTSTADSKLSYNYEDILQCPHLLPCGICRLTFIACPKYKSAWEITWNIENK